MNDHITDNCPKCGGEGVLVEQIAVDDFKPVGICPTCDGTEVVLVLCAECRQPFTPDEWTVAEHRSGYHTHERCLEIGS